MEYIEENGELVEKFSPVLEGRIVDKPDVHAVYLAKKRGDIMEDIAFRQQELADLEAEIESFNQTTRNMELGARVGDTLVETLELNKEVK